MTEEKNIPYPLSNEKLAKGLLLAREACGKSIKETSQLLGIPTSRLRNYEKGKYVPSLPELEILSYIYNIPLPALMDPDLIVDFYHAPNADQIKQLLEIRQQIIATRIRLAREELGKTYKDLSRETSISSSRLKKYEQGESDIAFDDLKKIADALEIGPEGLFDKTSPVGQWHDHNNKVDAFCKLSPEVQAFALSEDNQSYIELTQKVKNVGIEKLAVLSDSIQKIVDSSDPQD
jgi:transcriptional regulator with XRE-family HTH domain